MSQADPNPSGTDPPVDEQLVSPVSGDAVVQTESPPAPVASAERIKAIDVLRGFALLGILPPNITSFALATPRALNPEATGMLLGWDKFAWVFTQVFFQQKMITVFSMLFGAGLILMSDRADQRGQSIRGIYYRRLMWLSLIGLTHAFFIWHGDILVSYALCGLLLYPIRRISVKWLCVVGLLFYLIAPVATFGGGYLLEYVRSTAIAVEQAGGDATEFQTVIADAWPQIETELFNHSEKIEEEVETIQAGYWQHFFHRAWKIPLAYFGMALSFWWAILGLMLWGICLMRSGILRGERSAKFYLSMAVIGYLIGYPIVIFGTYGQLSCHFDLIRHMRSYAHFNVLGAIPVALGNVGLIYFIVKSQRLLFVTNRLAAVGRMALTNYLSHSVICTTIFYGWGFGYFEQLQRGQLLFVVVGIWLFQLFVSPLWLKHFRFGPMEWLWRTLTYWKWQPMRRAASH